jgi:pimeloyl-ACP methyl ester carboxylesterase
MGAMNRALPAVPGQTLKVTVLILAAVCCAACQSPEETIERSEPASGMVSVNEVELYYEVHGEGTALILLHGGLGHSGHWKYQLPALSEHYRVITVDSRGHGRSTMTEQQISYKLMTSDIVALMDYLEIERAHILGWSDGGNIGLYLAVYYPERLIKVIASGANYDPSGVRPDVGEVPSFVSFFEEATEDYQTLSPEPTNWDTLLGNLIQMWTSEPNITVEQLGSIRVPVLLLNGESDEAIYTEHTREMADLIPTARLILVPGTGHFGMWEKPIEINDAILEFLAQE